MVLLGENFVSTPNSTLLPTTCVAQQTTNGVLFVYSFSFRPYGVDRSAFILWNYIWQITKIHLGGQYMDIVVGHTLNIASDCTSESIIDMLLY